MKLRYFFLALALVVLGTIAIAGYRGHHFTRPPFEIFPDMNYQDKVKDQVPSVFFADGNSARAPIPGTVAEEMPATNDYWATGKWDDTHWGKGIPVHEARDGGQVLARVDRLGMCERGWRVDGFSLEAPDVLTIGLVYHVIMQRQQRQHAAAAGS